MDPKPQDIPLFSPTLLNPLSRLAVAAQEAADPIELAEQACRLVAEGLPGAAAWIALFQDSTARLQPVAQAGLAPELWQALREALERTPASVSLAASAYQSSTPQLARYLEAGTPPDKGCEVALAQGCVLGIAFPILVAGKPCGVCCVYSPDERVLDGPNFELLRVVPTHLGQAIRRIEAEAEQLRHLALLRVIRDLAAESLRSADLGPLLHSIIRRAAGLLDGSAASMYLTEPGESTVRCVASFPTPPDYTGLVLRFGEGAAGIVAQTGKPMLIADYPNWPGHLERTEGPRPLRALLSAPMVAQQQVIGVIHVWRDEQQRPFSQDDIDLLIVFADQAAVVLENARLLQASQRRLRELTLLQQVGQVINRRLETQPLLEEVVRQVVDVLGYPMVEILLVEGDHLVLRASAGMTCPAPERVSLDRGMIGRVARTNQPAFAPDVRFDPDYIPTVPSTQVEIVVPLRKGGVVFGVLNVESPERNSLTQDDVRLLSLLADQISVAIENAALYDHLRRHTDELERTVFERTASLAEALEKARQADRIKSQFVSDVSHELRTPLSNIRLYLDLLSLGKPERFEDYVETLTRETERLMRLIEDLLAISRLDAKTTTVELAPIDLNALAQSLVEDRRRLFAAKGIALELETQEDLPAVMGDERMISQVIANLLTNAMQYTPQGRVTVSTARRQEQANTWATLTVADTGLGIPEDEMPRLFERFFRGASSRTVRAPGTGLGLAICKEIIERHGGRITVSSRLGIGSEFTVWLAQAATRQP